MSDIIIPVISLIVAGASVLMAYRSMTRKEAASAGSIDTELINIKESLSDIKGQLREANLQRQAARIETLESNVEQLKACIRKLHGDILI